MWALRVLNGALAGKVINLKSGRNTLGRSPQCDISIPSTGISKEHCEIQVYPDKILIVDLKSSNGTFLNGVRIQNATLRMGDKMTVHDVILELAPAQEKRVIIRTAPAPTPHVSMPPMSGNAAPALHMDMQQAPPQPTMQQKMPVQTNVVEHAMNQVHEYIEKVALPGIYKLPQWFEYRWVLGGFVVLFVFLVTLLAMVPTFRSAKEGVMGESLRRAQSVSRHLAEINQKALLEGQYSALSTHSAELEEGVKDVFIVQKSDGMILAPPSRAGRIADESFVHKARSEDRPIAAELSGDLIGASSPIGQFDPATGLPSVKAYAVVIYDISGMVLDQSRAISLFMQILVLAAVIGSILLFFLIKLVEKPVKELNENLDNAMRERRDNITMPYLYPDLQALIGNVNSLLSRAIHSDPAGAPAQSSTDRHPEAQSLVAVSGIPAIAIGADEMVWSMNESFVKLIGHDVTGNSYKAIPDIALQQNLESLIQKCQQNPYSTYVDDLEFSGHPCKIQIMAFHNQGHSDYYFVTVKPSGGDG